MKCKKLFYTNIIIIIENYQQIYKKYNTLITFSFSIFLTYYIDVKEITDIIEKLKKIIHKDTKNQKALE